MAKKEISIANWDNCESKIVDQKWDLIANVETQVFSQEWCPNIKILEEKRLGLTITFHHWQKDLQNGLIQDQIAE